MKFLSEMFEKFLPSAEAEVADLIHSFLHFQAEIIITELLCSDGVSDRLVSFSIYYFLLVKRCGPEFKSQMISLLKSSLKLALLCTRYTDA